MVMLGLTRNKRQKSALAVRPPGNPEGKGLDGVMMGWCDTEPRGVVAKPLGVRNYTGSACTRVR